MKKVISIILWILIIGINVLQIINNSLDMKYLIEPFEMNDDICELKRIASEKLLNNTYTTLLSIILLIGYTVIILLPKSKNT